jgi:hypothetical protein
MTCYERIQHKSTLHLRLLNMAFNAGPDSWVPYYNFKALPVDKSVLDQDPLFKDLSSKREFMGGLLEIPPNSVYNWHVDTDRHCGLNMLVYDGGRSMCLFAPEGEQLVMPVVELTYLPNTYYAFNTKIPHTVINLSRPRYMFSLEFMGKDYGLTYDELLSDIKELGYGY